MTDGKKTRLAAEVLLETAMELQPAIVEALAEAIDVVRKVTLLLQQEESLRDAERALRGRKPQLTSGSSLSSTRWKRSERASRSLRELEHLGRSAADHSRKLARVTRRASTDRPDAFGHTTDLASLAREASQLDGRIRVQDLAAAIQMEDPERYSSKRSAYAAVYDQLQRRSDFERAGPGEFVLVDPFEGITAVVPARSSARRERPGSARKVSTNDLPFEAPSRKRSSAQPIDADDLPSE